MPIRPLSNAMKLYRPERMWLNDPKVFYSNGQYHLFHLQGKKVEKWEDIQKQRESYGHAVSEDCLIWRQVEAMIRPGKRGEWDDRGTWTGDIIEKEGVYYLLYTGVCFKDRIQRLGLAVSGDLRLWRKYAGNPVSEADPAYYENNPDNSPGYNNVAWRDPSLYFDKQSGWVYAYVCARLNHGQGDRRGCIGLIRSGNLKDWEALPPVYAPEKEIYHEVPQVLRAGNRYILFFGSKIDAGTTGCPSSMKCVISDNPFHWKKNAKARRIVGGQPRTEYSSCVYMRNNRYELIHLTYEGTEEDPKGYIRGRISLPKVLGFGAGHEPVVRIREDLKPRPGEGDDLVEYRNSGIDRKVGCKKAPFLFCKADGCSVYLRIRGGSDAEILVSSNIYFRRGMCIIPVDRNNHTCVRGLSDGTDMDYGKIDHVDRYNYEVVLIFAGKHIEIYIDDQYIATLIGVEDFRYMAVRSSGEGRIEQYGIRRNLH